MLMLSPVHSLRFCFLWYGLPSSENAHVKRVFTKPLAKLAIFLKKRHFIVFVWMDENGGFRLSVFSLFEWTECL